jgi:alpha-beta hydrolase superfamily lysophospholipase
MTFGYNARSFVNPIEAKTTDRIFTFGEELLVAINDYRVETYQRRRPLVLVGHSLGGIVELASLG